MKNNRMTLANKLTILRILSVPAVVIGLLAEAPVWPAAIYVFSALTDILDGALARARGEKTVLGSYLDPIADKLMMFSVYLTLAHQRLVPMWVFVIVFSRDLFILIGWNIISILTQNSSPAPRIFGKLSTFLQMTAAGALLLPALRHAAPFLIWPMVMVTIISTFDYVWVGAKRLSQLDL